MARIITGSTVIIALCLTSVSPALAQEHRFAGFDPPRGASATVDLRIPLGTRPDARAERPTIGLSAGYGRQQSGAAPDEPGSVRRLDLLDLRLGWSGIERARLAGFDLGGAGDDRLRIDTQENGKKTAVYLFIGLLLAIAAGVVLWDGEGGQGGPRPPDSTPSSEDG